MTDRETLAAALGKVVWAYVFFYLDFNLFGLNILPEWIGWLLILKALPAIAGQVSTAGLLETPVRILFFWNLCSRLPGALGLDSLRATAGLVHAATLVMAVLAFWFHFQFFTDLAALAAAEGCSRGKQLLRLRVVHVLAPTLVSLPGLQGVEWFYRLAVAVSFAAVLWTFAVLSGIKKDLTSPPEAPEA